MRSRHKFVSNLITDVTEYNHIGYVSGRSYWVQYLASVGLAYAWLAQFWATASLKKTLNQSCPSVGLTHGLGPL